MRQNQEHSDLSQKVLFAKSSISKTKINKV